MSIINNAVKFIEEVTQDETKEISFASIKISEIALDWQPNIADFIYQLLKQFVPKSSQFFQYMQTNPLEVLKIISSKCPRMVCGKPLNNEPAIKCFTCSSDINSIICMECFDERAHKGHNYKVQVGQGMCDCGYAQTIRPSGFCSRHHGNQNSAYVLEQNEQNFNISKIMAAFLFLSYCIHKFAQMTINMSESAEKQRIVMNLDFVSKTMIALLENPNDVFRNVFSRVIIYQNQEVSVQKILKSDVFSNIPKFFDINLFAMQYMQKTDVKVPKEVSFGLFFMLLNNVNVNHQCVPLIQKYLIEQQISEPIYRMYVSYAFYLKNPTVIIGNVNQNVHMIDKHSILFEKILIPPFDVREKVMPPMFDPWFNATVQSHTCIIIDDLQLILSQFSEQTEAFLINTRLCQGRDRYIEPAFANFFFFNQFIQEGMLQFKQLLNQKYPYVSTKGDLIKMNYACNKLNLQQQLLLNALSLCPYRQYYNEDLQNNFMNQQQEINQLFHRIQSIAWSMKNVSFIRQFFRYNLPTIAYLSNLQIYSKICIVRFKQRPCVKDDEKYTVTLLSSAYGPRVQYLKMLQCMFAVACISISSNPNEYTLFREITRSCDEHNKINKENNSYDFTKILKVLLCFELLGATSELNDYTPFDKCDSPKQISSGFGLHTLNASHSETCGKEYNHPVTNELITYIALILNIIREQVGIDKMGQSLKDCVAQVMPTLYTMDYNFAFINAECIRLLVTKSLFDAKLLMRCGEKTNLFFLKLYSQDFDKIHFVQFHWYQLIQQILRTQCNESYSMTDFIEQSAEQFGFYDIEAGGYEFNEKEDEQSALKLLADFIKLCAIISFYDLNISSPQKLLQYNILLLLIQFPDINISTIHQALFNLEFYNYDYAQKQLGYLANLQTYNSKLDVVYKTGQMSDKYIINENGITLIEELNPFFADTPSFIKQYETLCQKNNCLGHKIKILLDSKPQIDIYKNKTVLYIALCDFMSKFFLTEGSQISLVTQNEILSALLLSYNYISKLQSECEELYQIFVSISKKVQSGQLKQGIYIQALILEILTRLNLIKPEVSKKQMMMEKMQKLRQNTQQTQMLQINEQVPEEQVANNIDEAFLAQLKKIQQLEQKCSICSMSDSADTLCINVFIMPTGQLHNMLNGKQKSPKFILFDQEVNFLLNRNMQSQPKSFYLTPQQFIFDSIHQQKSPTQLSDNLYNQNQNGVTLQIRTCTHCSHQRCMAKVDESGKIHQCPICRQLTNIQIPIIQGTDERAMLSSVLLTATAVRQVLCVRQCDYLEDKRFSYQYLLSVLDFMDGKPTDEILQNQELIENYRLRGAEELAKGNLAQYFKNDIISIIQILLDVSLQNILLTYYQTKLDEYYSQEQKQNLLQNALKSSAAISFCAHYLFLSACGEINSHSKKLFEFEVEKEKFENVIGRVEQESKDLQLLVKFRFLSLFSKRNCILEGQSENQLTQQIYQAINLQNSMFLPKQYDKNIIQQQIDIVQNSKEKDLITDILSPEDYIQQTQLTIIDQVYRKQQTTLRIISNDQISIIESTVQRYKSIRSIFPATSVALVQNPKICSKCKQPLFYCMYCGKTICKICENLIQHCLNCNIQRAFFCPLKNVFFIFNSGAVHFTGGPYLNKNKEDDMLFQKQIPLELNNELLELLEAFLHYGNYYMIDLGQNVVNDGQFFGKIV